MSPYLPRTRPVAGRAPLLLAGVCGVLAWVSPARAQDARVENRFSPKGGVADAIVRQLDKATRTLDIGMYSISVGDQAPIFQALKRAVARGVKVRMVLDHANTGARNKQKALALERAGIDVRYVSRTMHEKFGIVDGSVLLNGSANWTESADQQHSENVQVLPGPAGLIAAFQAEFQTLLDRSKDFDPSEYHP
ncbi:MAG: DUF1669 domain-containing protein [Planctomycetes bacterium]|nr:DUF1669 domain-containing protein [Planctomycetota bacterium]